MSSSSILFIKVCHGCSIIGLSAAGSKMLSERVSQSAYAVLGQGAEHESLVVCTSCDFHKNGLYCYVHRHCIDLKHSVDPELKQAQARQLKLHQGQYLLGGSCTKRKLR